ncbi:MAG: ABC transporter substrate-binding protein [Chloroflexi bacterium]|nr:ABC transporter substrate-binding protein [Chloroflexota bacterium]
MKKKVVWLVVSGWMVAALLLAACAPAVVEETGKVTPKEEVVTPREEVVPKEIVVPKEETNFIKWTGTKLDGTVVEKMIEKPRYGGTLTAWYPDPPTLWDPYVRGGGSRTFPIQPTNNTLIGTPLTMGPVGTNEWGGVLGVEPPYEQMMGMLAESWEIPDDATIIYHIRQGIHWGLDSTSAASRLVGGREFTADDVVWFFRYTYAGGHIGKNYPNLIDMKNLENSIFVSPTDKWAVVFKFQPGQSASHFIYGGTYHAPILAREVVEKYGSPIGDWKQTVGTGAFFLKDYVTESSLTYVRNPNYWQHDPFFPENQLPYVDTYKVLFIPDKSTRMAALRTGKIAMLHDVVAEDADQLIRTNPELQRIFYWEGSQKINMRNDTKPFDDIRVRQALALAVNQQELVDLFYGGKASLFDYPIPSGPEFSDMYIPLEKMPAEPTLPGSRASVRELYGYNPDKAKQLLAEAGYPNGFKTEVLTVADGVDMLSVIKEYWAKIGVDLKIDVRDETVFIGMTTRKPFKYTQMMYNANAGTLNIWVLSELRTSNNSIVDNPLVEPQSLKMQALYYEPAKRKATMIAPLGEIHPDIPQAKGLPNWVTYTNEQAWFILLPAPYTYSLWQPWLKHYGGAYLSNSKYDQIGFGRYAWLDQDLKKAMGQ